MMLSSGTGNWLAAVVSSLPVATVSDSSSVPPPLLIMESMAASASSGLERLTALILAISSVTLVGLIFSTVGGAPATCSTIGGIAGDAYLGEEGPC